jgi:heat shock protein HtpX
MAITGTFAGAISMLAQFGFWFGGNSRNNPLGPLGGLLMIIVAPLAAGLVQLAISRTREYEADRDGAEISGDPLALASALSKISRAAQGTINVAAEQNPAMAHLYIISPLNGARMDNLFATHPAVENRIAELQRIANEMGASSRGPSRMEEASSPWRVPSFGDDEPKRGPWG